MRVVAGHTADPVHFGNFGGLWSKSVWFVSGLALSGLPLTGAYLHAQRQARRKGIRAVRPAVLGAYTVTVAVLGLSSAYGIIEIRGYALEGSWPVVPLPAAAFLIAWILSTLAILTLWMRSLC